MKYDKKVALKMIVNAAKGYEENLCDYHFKVVYIKRGKYETVYLGFRDNNFLHLTGVKSRLSAQRFYEACLSGNLSEKDFEMDNFGKVQRKLMVLPYIHNLLYNSCMLGDFINSGIKISADYFVGNTRASISIGFRYGKTVDMPVSLYSEDIRKLTNPTCKVIMIQRKMCKSIEYNDITYIAKGYAYVDGQLIESEK